ncbi:MAG: hypothetical protein ABI893_07825 [Polaromonas sp.]|uniref:hypothetical protein n=1 Tax=Polaromonas sp. TaxID=1869339 RepID=UPI00326798A3
MKRKSRTSAKRLSVLALVGLLAACTTYPKPSYNYVAASPDDPEFEFQSEFGVNTTFIAKYRKPDSNRCTDYDTVPYLQQPDSYLRSEDSKAVWKVSAPPDQKFVIFGGWHIRPQTMPTGIGAMATSVYYPGSRCEVAAQAVVPKAGEKYLVKLLADGPKSCKLVITFRDGKAAPVTKEPECIRK